MKNPSIRKYYQDLKKLFPGINFSEGKFLRELKGSLEEYDDPAEHHFCGFSSGRRVAPSPSFMVS